MIIVAKDSKKSGLLMVFIFILVLGQLVLADEQSWFKNTLDLTLGSRVKAKLSQEIRHNEVTLMAPYLTNVEGGLDVSLFKNLSISLLYRRQNEEKTDYMLKENRFMVDVNWQKKIGQKAAFDVRFRTEIRNFRESRAENHLRFRLRLRLGGKYKIGKLALNPFIAIEPFGDTLADEINRYRFYLGTVFPFGEHVGFLLGYIRQGTKDKETLHILYTGFQLKF
jgi:hypothetical protein